MWQEWERSQIEGGGSLGGLVKQRILGSGGEKGVRGRNRKEGGQVRICWETDVRSEALDIRKAA